MDGALGKDTLANVFEEAYSDRTGKIKGGVGKRLFCVGVQTT